MTGGLAIPSGDPQELRQLAAQLRSTAQASGDLGEDTSKLTKTIISDGKWSGDASDSFGGFGENLAQGAGAAGKPLFDIADAVDNYADALEVAQQQTQLATAIFKAAQNDSSGSMIGAAAQAGVNAQDALDVLQRVGGQAAQQVTAASDDLQVEGLFGQRGQVTSWVSSQPTLDDNFLWKIIDPTAPDVGGTTEIYPIGPELPTPVIDPIPPNLGGTTEIYPITRLGSLINYDAAQSQGSGEDPGIGPTAADIKFARKLHLPPDSPAVQDRGLTVQEYIAKYLKGQVNQKIPGEYLDQTVGQALQGGNSTVRKILTDTRPKFKK